MTNAEQLEHLMRRKANHNLSLNDQLREQQIQQSSPAFPIAANRNRHTPPHNVKNPIKQRADHAEIERRKKVQDDRITKKSGR